jgi:hypothetical protein
VSDPTFVSPSSLPPPSYSYDQHGKDGVEEAPKMDPGALYAMIFGSEKFEPLIG